MNKEVGKKHNGIISFWKFMFSLMIVVYHITEKVPSSNPLMRYGRIAVEFFFLVSGYLMTKTALNKKEDTKFLAQETVQYIWKKIKYFFPYVLMGFLLSFWVRSSTMKYSIDRIVNSIWNLLLVHMSGVRTTIINGMSWYITSMLISMLILYPLIRTYKKNFTHIVAPLIVFFVGGWIAYETGNLKEPVEWLGITYKGNLRALFEMSLGAVLYEITQKLKEIDFTFLGNLLLTIIEIAGFVSIFFIVNVPDASNKYDFIMLLILAISVTLAFSEKNIFYNITNNKFIYYLEKLSLPIYLNHNWIILLVIKLNKNASYGFLIIEILAYVIVASMLEVLLVEKLRKADKTKIKRLFIKSEQQIQE